MFIKGWNQQTIMILLVLAAVIILAVMVYIIQRIRLKKQRIIVSETSKRYLGLLDLNSETMFHEIAESYSMVRYVNSKQQYDRTAPHDVLLQYLREDREKWETILQKAEANRKRYERYMQEVHELPDYVQSKEEIADLKVPLANYQKFEKELCEENQLTPVCNVSFAGIVSYTSPQGRNHYRNPKIFDEKELYAAMEEIDRQDRRKETAQYQRQMMTQKLRYMIMKRDGFRCALCGRSAEDGIKLHVDHIKPVSKGGKTVRDNLRTLCEDCNLGKRDIYDEAGLN